jgi:hypothetical protein
MVESIQTVEFRTFGFTYSPKEVVVEMVRITSTL